MYRSVQLTSAAILQFHLQFFSVTTYKKNPTYTDDLYWIFLVYQNFLFFSFNGTFFFSLKIFK